MGVRYLAKPSIGRTLRRPLTPDSYDLSACMNEGEMDCKSHSRPQCLSLILPVGCQGQFLCQGNKSLSRLLVDHLNHTIPKHPEVRDQFPRVRPMPVEYGASRMFAAQLVYNPFFPYVSGLLSCLGDTPGVPLG